ncbi:RNA polymerase sigma-70 factor [Proteiniphilum saccharofermentans]|uniref:RNA polymerase sigma-70 factor n=1 Tax=Proteiniphilum saccharofermentans TaxID=1642647 RepID=A0A1R3T383_9BACT|nr:RNA polymerase sigma-70 factor [Proteiniphilum saccharofermentans]SCD18947.1 RNA polymerase sigma-70 factor [Proteiniphilum saccharofermentans]
MQVSTEYKTQFEEAYVSYYARMKRFARQYVIREEDAENIVQDIFFDLWEKQLEFSSFVNFNGFLFMMLKNRCIDFLRRKTLEQQLIDEIQSEYIRTLKLKFESLEALDNKFLNETDIDTVIKNAIDSLPEKCREIFVMNKIEGKKQKLIAQELNISVHTVESQMGIAYKKLKEALKYYMPLFLFFFI